MTDRLPITTIDATKDHVIAVFNRMILIVFERETTLAAVTSARRGFDLLEKKYPDGIVCMTVIAENAPLPSQEAREALGTLAMGSAGKRLRRSAVCFEGGGFRGALVRSVATGMQLVAKLPFPHRVFHSVDLAAAWLAPELGITPIVNAVDTARGKVVTFAKAR